ncbi:MULTISPECIES: hypothetical protein [unclassified Streptomyces]|uniref:hypothetical protein n=1 Tax=unclassified Streptomyces TaxID=2593676 RepID=UPI003D8BF2DC
MTVDVARVAVEDLLGVAASEDQEPVGALLAYRAYEAPGMRVAVGAAGKDLDHGDALAGNHGAEAGGELRVAVADEVDEAGRTVALDDHLAAVRGHHHQDFKRRRGRSAS